ncbi:mediator of RNA polymerase II transcription subunit 15a-like isoform X3 [Lotus japonicus]|nr:mediator of RNA polymerase II transcription subunit 15a-like isoform X3 [Lotus japonicus]XP_057454131.1 mediator of RNA polymerase II transcription subunit 15a-like isoform X3 [Lotus japonicus]
METLQKHLPPNNSTRPDELRDVAQRFEEKIFTGATSQNDYLRKISMKMLTMETRSQNAMANNMPSNQVGSSSNPPDQGLILQHQVHNPGQQHSIPLPSQAHQHQELLSQNIQNTVAPQPNLPPISSLAQTSSQNIGQNSNVQNIPVQNSVGSSAIIGQNSNIQNMFSGSQRQIAGGQQVVPQQKAQNPQQYIYQQHQIFNHKLQLQSQPHPQQQQNLLQSNKQSIMQPSMMQTSLPSLPQNQQSNNVQQSTQSMLQQQVFRHQQQQASTVHQQQTSMTPQPILPVQQQQQQLMGPQSIATNLQQQAQMFGPQSNVGDIQQPQRLLSQQNNVTNLQQRQQHKQLINQQNNLTSIHQQQLGNNVPGLRQQQLLGPESGNPGMQTSHHSVHTVQQPKVPMQQQSQQNALPSHGQQSQPQASAQQLMPQMQQQLGLQPQPNHLREIQQRLQASGSLLQQNASDQNKKLYESQRALPESSTTSLDSTAQIAQPSGADWQEEVYQKIQTMKENYFTDVSELYQKVALRLQQHDSLLQQPSSDQNQIERLRRYKMMLEHFMTILQISKNSISPSMRGKTDSYEKQIVSILSQLRPRKGMPLLQSGQLPSTHMPSMPQPQSQVTQAQPHDNQINSQLQPSNRQGSVATTQQNNISDLQHNSISGASTAQQSMMNSMRPGTNLDSVQGNYVNSLQQVPVSSLQQNPVSTPQQNNFNSLPSQGGVNVIQPNSNTLQSGSSMLQYQLKQQQEQQMTIPQLKQQYQQQQLMQRQQILQQQQQLHQQPAKQQMSAQLQSHQMTQLHQMNDMKMRQGMGFKQGVFQQHLTSGQQHSAYSHQKLKQGSSFSASSPQHLQAASPQISQHSSPQVDQQNNLPSLTKVATPLQSSNSPFVAPTPSPPMAPSPMPAEPEKPISGLSSVSNAANVGYQQTGSAAAQAHSLAIGTPGISASPLLAEFSGPDGAPVNALAATPEKSTTEQPLERLIRAVKSMSTATLTAAVNDIGSVVSMNDRIAVSSPGNGSRAAVGEDLASLINCCVRAGNFITQDDNNGIKRMKRCTEAVPLNVVSSSCSMNDSVKQLSASEASDQESTATSSIKKLKVEVNHALLEELRKINNRLIDTVVDISDEDADQTAVAEGAEGTVIKCSFTPVAFSPTLKSQYASGQMSTIQPLRLLIPPNYPNCSPILLDQFSFESSGENGDLSVKAKLRFSISLRSLSEPMSLGEIVRTWDACARSVISEYAQQRGGGSFSSRYGSWDAVSC